MVDTMLGPASILSWDFVECVRYVQSFTCDATHGFHSDKSHSFSMGPRLYKNLPGSNWSKGFRLSGFHFCTACQSENAAATFFSASSGGQSATVTISYWAVELFLNSKVGECKVQKVQKVLKSCLNDWQFWRGCIRPGKILGTVDCNVGMSHAFFCDISCVLNLVLLVSTFCGGSFRSTLPASHWRFGSRRTNNKINIKCHSTK